MSDSWTSWARSTASGAGSAFGAVKKSVWGGEEEKPGVGAAVAVGVKNAAVGAFRQISTHGEPIFKYVSGSKLGWRQVNEAGKGAIYKPTAANGLFTGLSMATLWGALGFDAFRLGKTVKKDCEDGGNYNNSTVMGASIAGAWAGAINGGAAGATVLSFVPFVPGVGTVVGGVTGGVLGAVYGAKAGEALGEAAVEKLLPDQKKSWFSFTSKL